MAWRWGRRGEADFPWEWCSTFPPPDVYSYCLSPTYYQGHAAHLTWQCWSAGLRPPFLLFELFLSEHLWQAPVLLLHTQTAEEMLTLLTTLCDKFMAQKTCSWKWLYFLSIISPHKYSHFNMPLILLVGKYFEANCKKSIKCQPAKKVY